MDTASESPSNVVNLPVPPRPASPTSWLTPEHRKLIEASLNPKSSAHERAVFMAQVLRSGMDPLMKECFMVPRRTNTASKGAPANWVTKYEFQPSEAGMLARAERAPNFMGCAAAAVYTGDAEVLVDAGAGEVTHKFDPTKRTEKDQIIGAWAKVARDGKLPVVVWLKYSDYSQETTFWTEKPATMIEKCARVAALRKAYPDIFAGLYIREEMPAEEFDFNHAPAASNPEQPSRRRQFADALAQRLLKAGLESTEVTRFFLGALEGKNVHWGQWSSAQCAQVERAVLAYEQRNQGPQEPVGAVAPAPATPPAASGPDATQVVWFGPLKGQPITGLKDEELAALLDTAHEKLEGAGEATWARTLRRNVAAMEAEAERRCRPLEAPAAPQTAPESAAPQTEN